MHDADSDKHAADDRRFEGCMEEAGRSGIIEFTGEYGCEIASFVPFANWLHKHGHLDSIRIRTYSGMRPYYFFLDDRQIEFKSTPREWEPPDKRIWPANETGRDLHRSKYHLPPDYRARFGKIGPDFDKPVLFVQNKFAVEWHDGPINYFPLTFLRAVFTRLQDRFAIVYSRPRARLDQTQFSRDHNSICDYPDSAVFKQFDKVTSLEDLEGTGLNYNELKLSILSRSHLFLAVQGGGAHILSYFGSSVLFLLHMWGQEYPGAYRRGRYKQLADPPPQLFVVRNWKDLNAAFTLFGDIVLSGAGASAGPKAESLLTAFRM